jgi:hypothetical protein
VHVHETARAWAEGVVDHRDYWNQVERRKPPYAGW